MSTPCIAAAAFPAAIVNRPSLSRIHYRIGQYSDFRAAMLSALDRTVILQSWTHRQPDDPGIALLEGAAILCDILTFYQELYANEAWLRTASWPESITQLVRLTGYRQAPGLGGSGVVAFELNGTQAVTVPAAFPLSVQIAGAPSPANFETSTSLIAVPALSRFNLYPPTQLASLSTGTTQIAATPDALAAAGVTLNAGDRVMLVDGSNVSNRQISVVQSANTVLDQTIVTLAGGWRGALPAAGQLTAYKLGRTFRAYGNNVPATQFSLNSSNQLTSSGVDTTIPLPDILNSFPLERQVDDLSAGIAMLVDLEITNTSNQTENLFRAATAFSVTSGTDSVGPMQGGITRVELQTSHESTGNYVTANRRTALCYEVAGQGFAVTGIRALLPGSSVNALAYYGSGASYKALDGRTLQFVALNGDDTAARVEETVARIDPAIAVDGADVGVYPVELLSALTQFTYADFPIAEPAIAVLGNVVGMTQGKTQPTLALGNGDARQVFESFQLPKSPLTWLEDESLTPPRAPQVTILVNQVEWSEVDSLYASQPNDQVYILREDTAGNTWVQFGDGVTGARLPSGVGNVTATYRTGNAANGSRQSGAKAQANQSLPTLKQLDLYNQVTGGTADEDAGHVRVSAPRSVEELGRIVSLADFEAEALGLPGVEKALAEWDTQGGVPLLALSVLMSDDTPAQLDSVQSAMTQANADRGANRFAVIAVEASLEYVYLSLTIGLAKGYQPGPVSAAVRVALGAIPTDGSPPPAGGLFSLDRRGLGAEEYASRIEGAAQNVEGVRWVQATAFGSLGTAAGEDPTTLAVPAPPALATAVACASNRVLALYGGQLSILAGAA
jgi:hypothetical protein